MKRSLMFTQPSLRSRQRCERLPVKTFKQAIVDAQAEEMRRDLNVFVMGEGIRADLYGTTTGLFKEFGPERVRDTPLSEAAIVGAAVGAAMTGMRPIVDFGVSAFLYVAMDQLVSQAAKIRYMFGGQSGAPIVVRTGMMYQGSLAAQHSDRPYPLFMHIPGFKVVVPSNPHDAKGLLKSAIRDDDAVLFFEDSVLASMKQEIPDDEYLVPFGVAAIVRSGTDVSIVAIGGSLQQAMKAAEELDRGGISAEVIDPRTLVPLDEAAILASVAKTGRLVLVEPANRTCGATAEIAAIVVEKAFRDLSAPIVRVTTPQTHIPFSHVIERPLYPSADKIVSAARVVFTWRR